MPWLDLKKLWIGCAILVVLLLLSLQLSAPARIQTPAPAAVVPPAPPLAAPSQPTPPEPPASPTYTYVGAVPEPLPQQGRSGNNPTMSAERQQRRLRQEAVPARQGEIPDLDIDIGSASLSRLIAHYGYVPAVHNQTRLLGKIAGDRFLPLQPGELANYATRGRSGAAFPQAAYWLDRVAEELHQPRDVLRLLFLVPKDTEQFFIAAQQAAVQQANSGRIALVRGHFTADLALVIDELVTPEGTSVPITPQRFTLPPAR